MARSLLGVEQATLPVGWLVAALLRWRVGRRLLVQAARDGVPPQPVDGSVELAERAVQA